jgi:hypothetical protein
MDFVIDKWSSFKNNDSERSVSDGKNSQVLLAQRDNAFLACSQIVADRRYQDLERFIEIDFHKGFIAARGNPAKFRGKR